MLWPISFGIAFIYLTFNNFYGWPLSRDFLGLTIGTIGLVAFGTIPVFIGVAIGFVVGCFFPEKRVHLEDIKLVSLRNSDGVQGRFFLGTGSIGSTEYYFYYENAGSGYRPGKIEVDNNVTIFEEEREDGLIRSYETRFVNDLSWIIGLRISDQSYEIVIPKGSLKQNFVLQ